LKVDELIATLYRNGVALTMTEDGLRYEAENPIPEELITELKSKKHEVLEYLQALQNIASLIGREIDTPDGKTGIVWGVCVYGVEILFPGRCVLLYDPAEVWTFNRLPESV